MNGSTYGNLGASTSLLAGKAVTLSAVKLQCDFNLGWCYDFLQWATSAGTIGNPRSSSTTFTPSGTGDLSMIVAKGNPATGTASNWAGYVWAGSNITAVEGDFNLTTASYVSGITNACTSQESMGMWVGIGGFQGSDGLWQAGITEMRNSSGSGLVIVPWYEFVSYAASYPPVFDWANKIASVTTDVFSAEVWLVYSTSGYSSGGYAIGDVSKGTTISTGTFNFPTVAGAQMSPDRTTADFIVESPGGCGNNVNGQVYPGFNTIKFMNPNVIDFGVSYLNFWQSVGGTISSDYWQGGGCSSGQLFEQALTPWWISSDAFAITYKSQCV